MSNNTVNTAGWIKFSGEAWAGDSITVHNATAEPYEITKNGQFTIWMDNTGKFTTNEPYSGGTKLLRDAAAAAERYNYKKMASRSGWKTRWQIRNV